MAKNNEAKVKFLADTSQFRDSISEANRNISSLNSMLKLASAEFKNSGDSVTFYSKKHDLLCQKLDETKSKEENIRNQIEVASRIYGDNSVEVQRLTNELTKNLTQQHNLEAQINDTSTALNDLASAEVESQSAYGKLSNTIDEQEAKLADLKNEYVNVVLEFGKSSQKAKDLENEYSSLNNELRDNRNRLNDAESALVDINSELSISSDIVDDEAESWSVMGEVLSDKVSGALSDVVDSIEDLAFESDDAFSRLQAQTGASDKAMSSFKDTIFDIYKSGVSSSFDDIADAVFEVNSQLGDLVDLSDFNKISRNALNLSNVYDMDVKESIRAVASMMHQFGISADDAFNLIVQGAQRGLNQNDDLLDTINEYSVQFEKAGFSAEDMFNMLLNGTKEGTWSVDKLGDAVKEMTIRFSDGSFVDVLLENRKQLNFTTNDVNSLKDAFNKGGDESKRAIDKVIKAILEVDDETERYKMGVGIFGTMWEDLGSDAISALIGTKGEIMANKDAIYELDSSVNSSLKGSFESLGNTLKVDLLQPIVDLVSPALKDAINWCKDNLHLIEPIISGIGLALASLAGFGIISGLVGIISSLINPFTLVIGGVAGLSGAFFAFYKNSSYFRDSINSIRDKFSDFYATLKDKFAPKIGDVKAKFLELKKPILELNKPINDIKDSLVSFFSETGSAMDSSKPTWEFFVFNIFDSLIDVASHVADALDNVIGAIKRVFDFISGAIDIVSGVIGVILDVVVGTLEIIGSAVTGQFDSIPGIMEQFGADMYSHISTLWSGIKKACGAAIKEVVDLFNGFVDLIVDAFKWLYDILVGHSIVPDMMRDIFNVIKSKLDSIHSFVSNILSKVKNVFKSAWSNIKSVVSSNVTAINSKVSSVFSSIKSNLQSKFSSISSFASNKWNTIKNSIVNYSNTIKSRTSSIFSSIKSDLQSKFSSISSFASSKWKAIKNSIVNPIEAARTKVKSIVDTLKSYFSNLSLKSPKIKMPHFSISGKFNINPPSVPKFSVRWYKDGAIFTSPTIFNTPFGFKGVGEAGHEAVLPLNRLQVMLDNAIKANNSSSLVDAIIDLANRDIVLNVNGKNFAYAIASDYDNISSHRVLLNNRGVSI